MALMAGVCSKRKTNAANGALMALMANGALTCEQKLPLDAHAGDDPASRAGYTLEAVRLVGNHGAPVLDAQEYARVLQHSLIGCLRKHRISHQFGSRYGHVQPLI